MQAMATATRSLAGPSVSPDPTCLPFVSVVIPALNEESSLPALFSRLQETLPAISRTYELIVVDDGSTDGTLALLHELSRQDSKFQYLSFARNFGHQAALIAGLDHSSGDVVITMDADLQHPPELLSQMVAMWQQGYEVVYTLKVEHVNLSAWRRFWMKIAYAMVRRTSGMQLQFGQSDFRLLDRQVVETLKSFPERNKFLRGLVHWVGFRQIAIPYETPPRYAGKAKYTLSSRVQLFGSGVFGFSILPLRLFTFFGILVSFVAFLYGIWAVALGVYALYTGYSENVPPGWASIAVATAFLGGIQLIGIGLLGEYIGRIYDETKRRPIYILRKTSDGLRADGKE